MTPPGMRAVETALARVDWLTERGSRLMRLAAAFAWLGAVAATVAVFSVLGIGGWVVGMVCLFFGWVLWRYGRKLSSALDTVGIRAELAEAAELAKTRIGDVIEGVQVAGEQPIRGGLRVLKTVRAVRTDLAAFGIDVSSIAEVANPGTMAAAAFSLFAGAGLWVIAVIGVAVRAVI